MNMKTDYYTKHVLYLFKEDSKDLEIHSDGREFTAVLSSVKNEDVVGDIMLEGAFDKYLKANNSLVMLQGHDQSKIIGIWKDMRMEGDKLVAEGTIYDDVTAGKDTAALIKRGVLKGVSIGFRFSDSTYSFRNDDDAPELSMEFSEVHLAEASIVLNPANEMAGITNVKEYNEARHKALTTSLIDADGKYDLRAIEKHLRQGGLSRTQAAELYKGLRDAGVNKEDLNDLVDPVIKWAQARNKTII